MENSIIGRIARKFWFLVIALALVGAGVGLLISAVTPPVYTSETRLLVGVQAPSDASAGDLVQSNNFALQKAASYVEVVPSERVLGGVIDSLGLTETPAELAERVVATVEPNSVVLSIAASAPTAADAQLLADTVASTFTDFVVTQLEVPLGGGISPVRIEALAGASLPEEPSTPNTTLNVALGGFAGLVLGLAAAFVLVLLDRRVRNVRDVEGVVGRPVLGGIHSDRASARGRLVAQSNPLGATAESYRSLRTNLDFVARSGRKKVFLVTSSKPNEGKTTLTANLATTLAENGSRVVVVDADLRSPGVARALGVTAATGLSEVLNGVATQDEAVSPSRYDRLDVLPAGAIPQNPAELLGSEQLTHLVRSLAAGYDFVLIDSPALLSVTDAAVISSRADGTIVVAAAGRVTRNELASTIDVLRNLEAPIAGVVVTQLPRSGPDSVVYGTAAPAAAVSTPGPSQ